MFRCIRKDCGGPTIVAHSETPYRRRRCKTCRAVFLTQEVEYELNGEKNPFSIARDVRKFKDRYRYDGIACLGPKIGKRLRFHKDQIQVRKPIKGHYQHQNGVWMWNPM
jgi:hypothetical protein